MDEMLHYRRLLEYNAWANRETLASLKVIPTPPARSLSLLGHVIGAEYLWLARLHREPPKIAVWPPLSLAECDSHILALPKQWDGFLNKFSASDLTEPVAYVNVKGEPWTNEVADILMHTVMHSVYHRAQIAADVRAAGHEPAYTDFIHAVRQGLVR